MHGVQSISLSSWIWRKAENELFFFIIGVSGRDYQSNKILCVMACDDMSPHVHANCVCVCDLMKAVACVLLQVAMSGCCIDWHGLDLCLEPLTMSDKASSSSLACARFPLGHSLTTRDWDSIRISERSVSSSPPGDLLLTQQKAHIHTLKPRSPWRAVLQWHQLRSWSSQCLSTSLILNYKEIKTKPTS